MTANVYVDADTLSKALHLLYATANHFLKIWFTLKHMGLAVNSSPVVIDTATPTPSLKRLFAYGHPDGEFFVPFAHQPRWLKMKGDAARSIIQTNIQRWHSSGSVVTCDPTGYLSIEDAPDGKQLLVGTTRTYPVGLGSGRNGFALEENKRVSIPLIPFAVWYGRQTPISTDVEPESYLVQQMLAELNLSDAECDCIFTDVPFAVSTGSEQLTNEDLYKICNDFASAPNPHSTVILSESFQEHAARIKSMISIDDRPSWLRYSPDERLKQLIDMGAKAILLYGPPRTGKTRSIDGVCPRADINRETIQIHDGWSYEHLIQGQQPDQNGSFTWQSGPLKRAIEEGKKVIVLEEINRTLISQSLGEVFSLIEEAYRGEENAITLRNRDKFYIPEDVLFLMTMNTIDRSTEDIDDALLGRFAAIEFNPRVEDLAAMLVNRKVPENIARNIRELYASILEEYPLGHGYFAQFQAETDALLYYTTKIRPVLANHLEGFKPEALSQIDNTVDSLFAQ